MALGFVCDNCGKMARDPKEAMDYILIGPAQGQGGRHSCSEPCDVEITKGLRKDIRDAVTAAKLGITGPNGRPPETLPPT